MQNIVKKAYGRGGVLPLLDENDCPVFEREDITKTSPCNEHPLTPHFYIVKLGFTGVYFYSLFLLQNIDCGYSLEPPQ